ncbi:MAG: hypothetical protein PQJ48_13080 [Sphaerochaetaceae bacterium]|nr:hypothetical protein [uncultured Sphaerochaeta sp.]MDC7231232.1 hypothetical protein [Sphaerochaetaceae bacterium]
MINYIIGFGAAIFLLSLLVRYIKRRRRIKAAGEMLSFCSGSCASCGSRSVCQS